LIKCFFQSGEEKDPKNIARAILDDIVDGVTGMLPAEQMFILMLSLNTNARLFVAILDFIIMECCVCCDYHLRSASVQVLIICL